MNAQNVNPGALFLLLPLGARTVALGEAVVADTSLGTEALWWNPAALARLQKREVAIHHSQTFAGNSDLLVFAYPSKRLGTLTAGVDIFDGGGDQAVTDSVGTFLGNASNRNFVFMASYATPIGKRLSVGLTGKVVVYKVACSVCALPTPSTNAIDIGAQYVLSWRLPITIGASARNLGQPFQVKDAEQADPLPRLIQVGARVQIPIAVLDSNDTAFDVSADVFSSPAYSGPGLRLGASLTYSHDYALRVGYKTAAGDNDNQNGFSIGFGFTKGSFGLDFARRFDSTSQLGTSPTYVSLRVLF
ncbi:MAG: PorV/PorQ family protein [Gemmatimonadaceae bacterium]